MIGEIGPVRVYVWWFGGSEGGPHGPVGYLSPSSRGTVQVDMKSGVWVMIREWDDKALTTKQGDRGNRAS